jgi:hypothetical protein
MAKIVAHFLLDSCTLLHTLCAVFFSLELILVLKFIYTEA